MMVGQQMIAERETCPTGMKNRAMLYESGMS